MRTVQGRVWYYRAAASNSIGTARGAVLTVTIP